jgi:hypothetical protein
VAGHGWITAEFFDAGQSRVHPGRERWSLTTVRAILANPRYTGRQGPATVVAGPC